MKKIISFLLPVLLLVSFAISGCSFQKNADMQLLLSDEPITLDPQIATDANAKIVVEALFEGLVRLDENNNPYPGVASSWEPNFDYTTFTFYLREDARWSDETPVTAEDFVFAFQRALDPATGSTTCESMFCIKNAQSVNQGNMPVDALGVYATDSHTLVVELEYANPDFPTLTASAPFMPCKKAYFEEAEGKYGLDSGFILGNGPFRMANRYSWEHDSYINLVRSETYTGSTEVSPATLTITIADSETDANILNLLYNGTTDAAKISQSMVSQADTEKLTLTTFQDTTWGLCFNVQSDNMKHLSVRKLFLQSLDREKLLSVLPETVTPANDIITPSTKFNDSNYRTSVGSGFFMKEDQTTVSKAKKKNVPAITILCPDDDISRKLANQIITDWNKNLDHYYNIEPLSQAELDERIRSGDYDIAITSIHASAEGPLSLLSLFRSDSKNNPAFLSNKTYDALLEITANSSSETVLANYRKAEQFLNDNAVFYPIYYETRYYAVPSKVTGVVIHPYELGIDFIHAQK